MLKRSASRPSKSRISRKKSKFSSKKKIGFSLIFKLLFSLFLMMGISAGLIVSKQSQDIRQQAKVGGESCSDRTSQPSCDGFNGIAGCSWKTDKKNCSQFNYSQGACDTYSDRGCDWQSDICSFNSSGNCPTGCTFSPDKWEDKPCNMEVCFNEGKATCTHVPFKVIAGYCSGTDPYWCGKRSKKEDCPIETSSITCAWVPTQYIPAKCEGTYKVKIQNKSCTGRFNHRCSGQYEASSCQGTPIGSTPTPTPTATPSGGSGSNPGPTATPPGGSNPGPTATPPSGGSSNPGPTAVPPSGSIGSNQSANGPIGFLDVISSDCTMAQGWSCDPDDFKTPIKVRLFDGDENKLLGEVTADSQREAGVGNMCGGRSASGYKFTLPESIRDGKLHKIFAVGVNIGKGSDNVLAKSPISITCPNTSGSPGGGTAALPNSGTFSHSCDTSGSTIGFNLSVNNTSPANVGTVSFFLGFWGKYHNKALTDDFLGKPTWSTTCHDQEWCGYHLRFVQDPNPNQHDASIGFKWDNSYKIGSNQRTLAQIAQKIDDLKASGDLPATYQLPIHVEYRLPNGGRYNMDGNNTRYLNVTKNSCSFNNKKVVIMAKSTKLDEVYAIMQLKYKGKLVKQWNTNDKLRSYEAEVPAVTKISDLTVHFVNDANKPPLQDRNLSVESLEFDNKTYKSNAVNTYSTGTWSKDVGCAPGKKQSSTLHCNGYFKYE